MRKEPVRDSQLDEKKEEAVGLQDWASAEQLSVIIQLCIINALSSGWNEKLTQRAYKTPL